MAFRWLVKTNRKLEKERRYTHWADTSAAVAVLFSKDAAKEFPKMLDSVYGRDKAQDDIELEQVEANFEQLAKRFGGARRG